MQQMGVAAQGFALLSYRVGQRFRPVAQRYVSQIGGELLQNFIGSAVVGELVAGLRHQFAEGLAVDLIERRTDDADLGSQVGTG